MTCENFWIASPPYGVLVGLVGPVEEGLDLAGTLAKPARRRRRRVVGGTVRTGESALEFRCSDRSKDSFALSRF